MGSFEEDFSNINDSLDNFLDLLKYLIGEIETLKEEVKENKESAKFI